MATGTKLKETDSRLKNVTGFEVEESSSQVYRYLTGKYTNYTEAISYQNELRKKGMKDAFVVAYKNGNRITLDEALSELKN